MQLFNLRSVFIRLHRLHSLRYIGMVMVDDGERGDDAA